MKKTLTVNLNNIVFHIDDDAYEMLQTYLHEIADYFQSEDEKKEIMNDIEARIAELFTEKLQKNKNVVNLTDVQEVIEIMGKPSQYADENEEPNARKSDTKTQNTRRFYRDPENALLAGVAGGLAAYFNLDVTLIRVILVILSFVTSGTATLVYILVWLVAPQAITASQRLEMQGEDVTVESIKTELNNAKNYVESDRFKQTASTAGERILDIIRIFFKVIFGFVGAILGLVAVVLVGALIFVLFFIIFEPTVVNGFAPDLISNWSIITPEKMVMLIVSLILLVGCPIFLLSYWAVQIISGRNNSSRTASWVVLILWLAGMFMFYSIGANTFLKLRQQGGSPFSINWSVDDDNGSLVDEVRNCEPFNAIDVAGNIDVTIVPDSIQKVTLFAKQVYLPKIFTKVENGVLHIYSKQIYLNQSIKVIVYSDSIKSVKASGACHINTESELKTADFKLELTGACQAEMDLQLTGSCFMNLTGASQADITGSCNQFKLDGTGACQVDASDFISKNAFVNVSGASQADVHATVLLDAKATGASQIDCTGNPKSVNKNTHIGSEINVE